ncbi:MAG: CRISPR-associated protein, Cse3 family [Candidatus Carbobacillus altaicus]|uniref:CRISPR-associated protein, Cse3 family n=1 Tax=Candidatus Carbonibacillus altaicus TaxID=2163959 RepID=A0A2R6XZB3_9BACL|nr:MAG: CRISPR-associated protein, Cse3 family [Candidatus Carbobacillus altaicus]
MNTLYMIEIKLNLKNVLQYVYHQEMLKREDEDLGYALHVWLKAAFQDIAPKPWRLLVDERRPSRLLAYSLYDGESLKEALLQFADPSASAAVEEFDEDIQSKKMPIIKKGTRLGFELFAAPVGRKARSGVEKDYFLLKIDQMQEHSKGEPHLQKTMTREEAYHDWLKHRLEKDGSATLHQASLDGFRLVKMHRRTQRYNTNGQEERHSSQLVRPQVLLRGELSVNDEDKFQNLLLSGVGRHTAFGYGMLLLRPPQKYK